MEFWYETDNILKDLQRSMNREAINQNPRLMVSKLKFAAFIAMNMFLKIAVFSVQCSQKIFQG